MYALMQATQVLRLRQVHELKERVKNKLLSLSNRKIELLSFINDIQCLGVGYHVQQDIEDALQQISSTCNYECSDEDDDLYFVSLQFRLLRQNGFHIPSDVFNKFKDDEGLFKNSLTHDVQGMLSLYEASHLGTRQDDVLDEALLFTSNHLKSMAACLSEPLAMQVKHALRQPYHKGMLRVESRHYITIYEQNSSHDEDLLKLAKLDFNVLQKLHNMELKELSRWWKELGISSKLPIRDRVPEAYFWSFGPYYEPEYSLARIIFCKIFKMASIVDDTYDAYGTIEELELLTTAIERWEISCINELPDYMKPCYKALLDTFEQFESNLVEGERSYRVDYAQEQMKSLCRAYLKEARWLHEKHVPTYDEYMSNAIISFGYILGTVVSFLGMGEVVTKEALEWASENPKVVNAAGIIGRLLDDMGSHNFEQSRDHVPSAVECFMRQHGVSQDKACLELHKKVREAWKVVNEALLRPTVMPVPLLDRVLNLCRVTEVIYKGADLYTFANSATMKGLISSMFVDPIPM
ncbi:(-)-drimenol synthase-like protein [Drosera capensis]